MLSLPIMAGVENPFLECNRAHPLPSACPNCSFSLEDKSKGVKTLHTYCPVCRARLTHVWWQRALVTALVFILAFGLPAAIGIRRLLPLLFTALLLYFPALVGAMMLVFKMTRPKYVKKSDAVTALFQR
jgi:hypothetical protein